MYEDECSWIGIVLLNTTAEKDLRLLRGIRGADRLKTRACAPKAKARRISSNNSKVVPTGVVEEGSLDTCRRKRNKQGEEWQVNKLPGDKTEIRRFLELLVM